MKRSPRTPKPRKSTRQLRQDRLHRIQRQRIAEIKKAGIPWADCVRRLSVVGDRLVIEYSEP